MKILITDDHPIVRKGIRQILQEFCRDCSIEEASSALQTMEKLREGSFDALILDITLPDKNGLDLLKQIRAEDHTLPVLIVSILPEEHYAVRALQAGAAGYLAKESAPEELEKAIARILSGGRYVSASLGEHLASIMNRNGAPHENLSAREFQVMCMLAAGKRVTDISRELSVSIKTVSTHRSRILFKMKMQNNAEITGYALQNHLIC